MFISCPDFQISPTVHSRFNRTALELYVCYKIGSFFLAKCFLVLSTMSILLKIRKIQTTQYVLCLTLLTGSKQKILTSPGVYNCIYCIKTRQLGITGQIFIFRQKKNEFDIWIYLLDSMNSNHNGIKKKLHIHLLKSGKIFFSIKDWINA